MAKRMQPLTAAEAAAAYDRLEVIWRQADEWCRTLEGAFTKVLDQHTAIGTRLTAIFRERMAGGSTPEGDALWVREAQLREQLAGVMACRRAAAKRRDAVLRDLDKADRAHERAAARRRKAIAPYSPTPKGAIERACRNLGGEVRA